MALSFSNINQPRPCFLLFGALFRCALLLCCFTFIGTSTITCGSMATVQILSCESYRQAICSLSILLTAGAHSIASLFLSFPPPLPLFLPRFPPQRTLVAPQRKHPTIPGPNAWDGSMTVLQGVNNGAPVALFDCTDPARDRPGYLTSCSGTQRLNASTLVAARSPPLRRTL